MSVIPIEWTKEIQMRKAITLASVLFLALAAAGSALAAGDSPGSGVTVKGEILDMACYLSHGASGPEHAGCAKKCVEGGQPMGLLADDGNVYLLFASHSDGAPFENAKKLAGEKVEITGTESTQHGIKGIEVHGVRKI